MWSLRIGYIPPEVSIFSDSGPNVRLEEFNYTEGPNGTLDVHTSCRGRPREVDNHTPDAVKTPARPKCSRVRSHPNCQIFTYIQSIHRFVKRRFYLVVYLPNYNYLACCDSSDSNNRCQDFSSILLMNRRFSYRPNRISNSASVDERRCKLLINIRTSSITPCDTRFNVLSEIS
jgi:hypothetical protein